jgi:hypothetical protein
VCGFLPVGAALLLCFLAALQEPTLAADTKQEHAYANAHAPPARIGRAGHLPCLEVAPITCSTNCLKGGEVTYAKKR